MMIAKKKEEWNTKWDNKIEREQWGKNPNEKRID